jgi:hypothetical protein
MLPKDVGADTGLAVLIGTAGAAAAMGYLVGWLAVRRQQFTLRWVTPRIVPNGVLNLRAGPTFTGALKTAAECAYAARRFGLINLQSTRTTRCSVIQCQANGTFMPLFIARLIFFFCWASRVIYKCAFYSPFRRGEIDS